MANRVPSYNKLFTIQNQKIGAAIMGDDSDKARKEIDILERLIKLEKSFIEFAEIRKSQSQKNRKVNTKIAREKLLNELEQRFIRIREANQHVVDLK